MSPSKGRTGPPACVEDTGREKYIVELLHGRLPFERFCLRVEQSSVSSRSVHCLISSRRPSRHSRRTIRGPLRPLTRDLAFAGFGHLDTELVPDPRNLNQER